MSATVLLATALGACTPGNTDTVIPVNGSTTSQATVGGAVPLTVLTPDLNGWVDSNGRYFLVQTVKLQAFGGAPQGGYTWNVRADQPLPFSTLSLDPSTGVFQGTLPSTTRIGRYNFGVDVTDGVSVVSAQFSLLVSTCASTTSAGSVDATQCHFNDALSSDPGSGSDIIRTLYANNSLTAFGSGVPFGYALAASGGKPPYSNWRIQSGSLPSGLQIDTLRGVVYGTPASSGEGITYSFGVAVTDTTGVSAPTASTTATQYTLKIGKP